VAFGIRGRRSLMGILFRSFACGRESQLER
jgi:hypothetical protein